MNSALTAHCRSALQSVFRNRRLILVGGSVTELAPLARELRQLGAARPFIIGSSLGAGQPPAAKEADWCSLEVRASDRGEAQRRYENLLHQLPEEARARMDAYDPSRSAVALGVGILGELPQVGGRPRYGARPRRWAALDDKVVIDELWDAIGVHHAPSRVVHAADRVALLDAAQQLDEGRGTVWAADAREGITQGAEGLRWVQDAKAMDEALDFFIGRCDRVRVMPFLRGTPCSINGMVLAGEVAIFRPLEQLTLASDQHARLLCAGAATQWRPPLPAVDALYSIGHRVGSAIAERVGFRGAFAVDGVWTDAGFLPTELNARLGTGVSVFAASLPELPLTLLALTAEAGEGVEFYPDQLEQLIGEATDARPQAEVALPLPHSPRTAQRCGLVEEPAGYRVAAPGEAAHAELRLVPADVGALLLLEPPRVSPGPPLAPRVAQAFQLADQHFELGLGTLRALSE